MPGRKRSALAAAALLTALLAALPARAVPRARHARDPWQRLERLVGESKLEQAARLAAELRDQARAAGDEAGWTRGLVRETQVRIALHGHETAVRLLLSQPWPRSTLHRTTLDLFHAAALVAYYRDNSWQIQQRERVVAGDAVDLALWTSDQIFEAAAGAYRDAWLRRTELGVAPVARLADYVEPNNYPPGVRGTLRDTLAYLYAGLLADSSFWSPRQSNELFMLDVAELVAGDPARAATVKLDDPAVHPLAKLGAVLADLEAWHAGAGRRAAALEARLERVRRLHAALPQPADQARLRADLETRLAAFRSEPAEAPLMDEKAIRSAATIPFGGETAPLALRPPPPPVQLRSDFAETGFWQPHLLTGDDGTATIEFTVPDSVTAWSVWVHALDQNLRGGSLHRETRSIKELMVRPYLPRFLREGDHAELKVVVDNASGSELAGELRLEILDPASGKSLAGDFGLAGGAASVPFRVAPGAGVDRSFPLTAPRGRAGAGPVAFKVTATAGGLGDGELRALPVLPSRLHLTQSRFVALRGGAGEALSAAERRQILDASFRRRREQSRYPRAMLALALARAGRRADAALVWDSVMDAAKTTPEEGTFWAPEEHAWLWYQDTVESHALALRVMTELAPDDPRAEGLVQRLFLQQKLGHWKCTRATAEVLYSLAAYLERHGQLAAPEAAVVRVGGRTTSFVFEPDRYTGGGNRLVVSGARLDPRRDAVIEVEKQTPGTIFASASWDFSTERPPEQGSADLFAVSRRYFKRVGTGTETVLLPLDGGESLAVGDEVEVQLALRSRVPAEYVHLRDPRAAGREPAGAALSGYRWDLGLVRYEETHDSGADFFFESLPAGEYTLRYRLRANLAGTFRVGPATMQSMYAPEFSAYSAGGVLVVSPGKSPTQ
jgi:hypothetical protein